MSDFLKTSSDFEKYFENAIQNRTDKKYKLNTEKKMIMLDRFEKNQRLECFCNSNILCPCDGLDDMLKKSKKCHCGFIKGE